MRRDARSAEVNVIPTHSSPGLWRAAAFAVLLLAGLLAGCDGYPRDPEGTTERVQQSGTLRGGLVATGNGPEDSEREFAERIAGEAGGGAEVELEVGSAETLLRKLKNGELDLVVGYFADNSPWKSKVAFTKPKAATEAESKVPVLRAAVRRGENRWLILVERSVTGGGG